MDAKVLIDSILRQTVVLIAQLATTSGIRAPLSHMADEVFLELTTELEAQGVSRKVVADMFGLALRGYQKRVQRLRELSTSPGQTLWQAVLEVLQNEGPLSRKEIFRKFRKDDPAALGAVLSDLTSSGLAYRTGSGESALYGVSREEDRLRLAREGALETASALLWLEIARHPNATEEELGALLPIPENVRKEALRQLVAEGRASLTDGHYRSDTATIPVGAEAGWEAAVFDHYRSVCAAIGTKLRLRSARSESKDIVGGATLTFDLAPGHPLENEVKSLLACTRGSVDALWNRVEQYNREHPIAEEDREVVTFYFGQSNSRYNGEA
jgi:hypothetical protein